jgi:hypothetical protein
VLPRDRDARRLPAADPDLSDPEDPSRYVAVRGRVLAITEDGAAEHIEQLAQRYLGGPYPWFGGRDQTRLLVTIAPESVTSPRA